jgi:hypothetical protein
LLEKGLLKEYEALTSVTVVRDPNRFALRQAICAIISKKPPRLVAGCQKMKL